MAESWESILGVDGPPVEGEPAEFEAARSAFGSLHDQADEVHQTFRSITDQGVPEDKLNNLPGRLLLRAIENVDGGLGDLPRIAGEARDVLADHITALNDLRDRADEALVRAQTVSANQRAAQAAVDGAPKDAENLDELQDELDTADAAIDGVREEYWELSREEDALDARTVDALDSIDFGALEPIAPAQQLIAFAIDPAGWFEWLTGPEGPSVEDLTGLVPGLPREIGNLLDGAMGLDWIAGPVGKAFGFEYVEGQDFYTTNEHSIQSLFGFHDVYDKVHKLFGMDLDDEVFEFQTSNGEEYRVELWKGGYASGGAFGGEVGVYTRQGDGNPLRKLLERIPGYYSTAQGENQVKVKQTIYNKRTGQEYFTNAGEGADGGPERGDHYWNLAIRTDPTVPHEELGQRGTLEVRDPEVGRGLYAAMKRKGLDVQISPDGKTVTYSWE